MNSSLLYNINNRLIQARDYIQPNGTSEHDLLWDQNVSTTGTYAGSGVSEPVYLFAVDLMYDNLGGAGFGEYIFRWDYSAGGKFPLFERRIPAGEVYQETVVFPHSPRFVGAGEFGIVIAGDIDHCRTLVRGYEE